MQNRTLFLRSLAIIMGLAGLAHLGSKASHLEHDNPPTQIVSSASTAKQSTELSSTIKSVTSVATQGSTSFIIGKWKVKYDDPDFKGSVIYDFKKEGEFFNAYTYQYQDESGNAMPAEGTKTLIIQAFDGETGSGIYQLEYEGSSYNVDCEIKKVDQSTLIISYSYYGYGDTEIWRKL